MYLKCNMNKNNNILNKIYKVKKIYVEPNISSGALFLFFLILIIFYLSFILEKNNISRNWEKERCNYIFTSGFIKSDNNVNPFQYTKDNMNYCIKKHIYTKGPIIPYLKKIYKELDYLVNYLKVQINIYNKVFYRESNKDLSGNYHSVKNKINYLKRKERNIEEIQNKINNILNIQNDKMYYGYQKLYNYDKQKKLIDDYRSGVYDEHLVKLYDK